MLFYEKPIFFFSFLMQTRNPGINFRRLMGNYVGVLWGFRGFPLLWCGCIPQHKCMKNIGKKTNLKLCEVFLYFCAVNIGWFSTIKS